MRDNTIYNQMFQDTPDKVCLSGEQVCDMMMEIVKARTNWFPNLTRFQERYSTFDYHSTHPLTKNKIFIEVKRVDYEKEFENYYIRQHKYKNMMEKGKNENATILYLNFIKDYNKVLIWNLTNTSEQNYTTTLTRVFEPMYDESTYQTNLLLPKQDAAICTWNEKEQRYIIEKPLITH